MYWIGIRGERWWWSIFTEAVDVSIKNSWILYRCVNKDIFLFDSRRSVVRYYLKSYKNLPNHSQNSFSTKGGSIDCGASDSIRIDGYMHLIQATYRDQRRRYAGVGCSSRVRTECKSAIWVSASPALPLFTNTETVTKILIRHNIACAIPENEFNNIILLSLFAIRTVILISLCFVVLMRIFSLGELCSRIRPVVPYGH